MSKNDYNNLSQLIESHKKKQTKSSQLLGEFGEFVYKKFASSKNLQTFTIRFRRADVMFKIDNNEIFIDVKSTVKDTEGYKGNRPQRRFNYYYDQVVINEKYIKLNPDKDSPIKKYNDLVFKNPNKFFIEWKTAKKEKKHLTIAEKKRKEIKKKIEEVFNNKNIKIRVLHRGEVSDKGWGSKQKPDNIPGSEKHYKKFMATILVQYIDKNKTEEEILRMLYFNHNEFGYKIKLTDSISKRQKDKGVYKIIDYDNFEKNNSEYIFKNLNELKIFVNKKLN